MWFLIAVLAAFFALYLNHRFRYLIYVPFEKIGKRDFIKMSLTSITMLLCIVVVFGATLRMIEMKEIDRVWSIERR
ncbi:hypothetical protein RVBP21_0210 [Pseudomonas phage BRkr]|nr:hypothetical protein RVBP21_0210 [Pseudomonas phage BRkr]